MSSTGKFYGKLIVEGTIECVTGMHIGTGKEVMEIGGIDIPVVRDPLSREPYIPGSSLKGKLRSLLEKQEFAVKGTGLYIDDYFNKTVDSGGLKIRHHECNVDDCSVCRLYGASKGKGVSENRPARLIVSDAYLKSESKQQLENIDTGLYLTELKFENTLDRITSAASPRQIERVPRGTEFEFTLIYNQDEERNSELFAQDIKAIFNNLRLLDNDAIGGNVSRGYGRIKLKNLCMKYRPLDYYREGDQKKEVLITQGEQQLSEFINKAAVILIKGDAHENLCHKNVL